MNLKSQVFSCSMLVLLLAMGGIRPAVAQINTGYGANALASITSGISDSGFGADALASTTSGTDNSAFGTFALIFNTIGSYNTASGSGALFENISGNYNSAHGYDALINNTTGSNNVANGAYSLYINTTGSNNVANGYYSLRANSSGKGNTASGYQSLYSNTTGIRNNALGSNALYGNTTGSNNIAIGYQAGYYLNTGNNNIEIGAAGAATDNAVIRIGTQGTQGKTYLAGVRGVNVTGGVAVMVTASGQLGVVSSSRRYKEDIRSMGDTSDRLLKLRPVTFRYKLADEQGQKPEQYGLIAEEVAKVMPELVVYNEKGQPETVAYQTLTPLLLNELQREHAQIAKMQSQIDGLLKARK